MTGGQMQILMAELQKVLNKLDLMDKNTVRWREDNTDPTDNKKPKGKEEPTLESFSILEDRIVSYFANVSERQLKIDLEAAGYLPPIKLHKTVEPVPDNVEMRKHMDRVPLDLSSSQELSGESAESHSTNDQEPIVRHIKDRYRKEVLGRKF